MPGRGYLLALTMASAYANAGAFILLSLPKYTSARTRWQTVSPSASPALSVHARLPATAPCPPAM